MSIETNIDRIATALESIAKTNQAILEAQTGKAAAPAPTAPPAPVAEAPAPEAPPAPKPAAATTPAPPVATPPPQAAPAPAAAAEAPMLTAELINEACKQKATQLGGPDKIRELFSVYGVNGVAGLDPSAYTQFKEQLDALK